jgi:hypothetical protein
VIDPTPTLSIGQRDKFEPQATITVDFQTQVENFRMDKIVSDPVTNVRHPPSSSSSSSLIHSQVGMFCLSLNQSINQSINHFPSPFNTQQTRWRLVPVPGDSAFTLEVPFEVKGTYKFTALAGAATVRQSRKQTTATSPQSTEYGKI